MELTPNIAFFQAVEWFTIAMLSLLMLHIQQPIWPFVGGFCHDFLLDTYSTNYSIRKSLRKLRLL
tara:strand:+ start:2523 stop:2717 length:195 start_codon:yes stop_codon:yes gene_type:complete